MKHGGALRQAVRATLALGLTHCASAPTTTGDEPVSLPTVSARAATPIGEGPLIGVGLVARPRSLAVDGKLAEWGALPALGPSLLPPREQLAQARVRDNPSDARSRVFAAVDGEGVALAIELADGATEAWIGIGSMPAEPPLLGQYFGRMGFVPTSCLESPRVEGEDGEQGYWMEENPPEVVAACEALLGRVAAQQRTLDLRYERWLHVRADRADIVDVDGRERALRGATVRTRTSGDLRVFEASLPLSALPRFSTAPVELVRLAASTKAPDVSRSEPSDWVWLATPAPVRLHPQPELLEHAFARAGDVGDGYVGSTSFKQSRALSYHPAEPSLVEVIDSPTCEEYAAWSVALFERIVAHGSIEVGQVASPRGYSCATELESWAGVLRDGKVASIAELPGTRLQAVVRGEDVHVLSWNEQAWETTPGRFTVLVVKPDGSTRDAVLPLADVKAVEPHESWSAISITSSADPLTFGWKATRAGKEVSARYAWDERAGGYAGTVTTRPLMKEPKRR